VLGKEPLVRIEGAELGGGELLRSPTLMFHVKHGLSARPLFRGA
jgi:hypothetical protein